jgi:hypothetical protein
MSPLPYVRAQAVALAVLLIASGVLGASLLALLCALGSVAGAALLSLRYRHDVAVSGATIPPHRARLDDVVSGDAVAALGSATLLVVVSLAFGVSPGSDAAATARVAIGFLAIAAAAIYLSSLVDWYLILPRVSGQLGARPCRDRDPRFPFPHSWKEVTRWWYIHRIVATVAFRFLLAAAIASVLGQFIGAGEEAKIIAGLVLGVFATYFSTLSSAVFQGAQPRILVGETVIVRARPRRQWWPPFSKVYPPDLDSRQYVVDVSLEGIHMTAAAPREQLDLPDPRFVREVDRLPLVNHDSARLSPREFSGCAHRCSGINWYCIKNPRCFEAK